VDAIKSLPPADGSAERLVPGEGGRRTGAERAASGIPLGPRVWLDLTEVVATTLDVPDPAPLG
jgi:ureidoglycolate dehydrogenase (NAD+)